MVTPQGIEDLFCEKYPDIIIIGNYRMIHNPQGYHLIDEHYQCVVHGLSAIAEYANRHTETESNK